MKEINSDALVVKTNCCASVTLHTEGGTSLVKSVEVELQSTITCPNCGHQKEETMPTDTCQFFYACENCHQVLKPKHGDCCVYCSYGTVKCPPIQENKSCC